jgi:hydrophobe/amphiphile efflux-1 (HAE1) family protein
MSLPQICIQRPVFAVMLNLALIVFGIVAYTRLPVRELPDIDPPIVSVTTIYTGANAEVIENEVTEPLEQELNNISGIKAISSESRQDVSVITVEFELNVDVDVGAQDVRDRVSRVRGRLPDDTEEPIVAKQDADAEEILWIALYSDRFSTLELSEIGERQFKDRLQTVPGLGGVNFGGEKRKAIRLRLDSEKMAARQITVQDIRQTFQRENVELPSGLIENRQREFSILTRGQLSTPEEFENLIVRFDEVAPVRMRDIALVELGVEDERTVARYNGRPAVGLGIVKQSKGNTVEVADRVKEEVERIRPSLPEGVEVEIAYDSSLYIRLAIQEVKETLFIAFGLVVFIIFVFLRSIRATLIPAAAIPVSIIGTFSVMLALGFSINILTLLALVLVIGVVVDDAIVVLENIYRHIEEGLPPKEAALKGMSEITLAIIATTLSLVAVFVPLAFQQGTTGVLFREFAIAVAGAVIISSFVALTLSPTMCALILKPPRKNHHRAYFLLERVFNFLITRYTAILTWTLRRRWIPISVGVAAFALAVLIFTQLEREFLPEEDKGYIIGLVFAPEGATGEFTNESLLEMERIVTSFPEVEGYFSAVALSRGAPGQSNFGIMFVRMKPERSRSVQQIIRPGSPGSVFTQFIDLPNVIALAFAPKVTSFGESYQLVLQCQDLKRLDEVARNVRDELAQAGFLSQPRLDFNFEKPQIDISIDRDRAAALGVSVREISETLQMLLGGLDVSDFREGGKQYDVIAQLQREDRLTPEALGRLHVRTRTGELAPLTNLLTKQIGGSVNTIFHYNRFRSATISGDPFGVELGKAITQTEALLERILPSDVTYEWKGESRELKNSTGEAILVLLLALIIIYMVLASLFESLTHPFTVMLAIPLACLGAFGLLYILNIINGIAVIKAYAPLEELPAFLRYLTLAFPEIPSMNINLYSIIGMVLLMGLVTKNSILLVEFANQKKAQGLDAVEAMILAGKLRLRPILMTALSTIIGLLPIALALGTGAEGRRPLGIAVIGGMATSTFLTLFVIPAVYTLLDPSTWRKRHPTPPPKPPAEPTHSRTKIAATLRESR